MLRPSCPQRPKCNTRNFAFCALPDGPESPSPWIEAAWDEKFGDFEYCKSLILNQYAQHGWADVQPLRWDFAAICRIMTYCMRICAEV
jgi:hypothetical protein